MAFLPTFPTFDVKAEGNCGPRWDKYVERFERLLTAMDVKDEDTTRKRAMLLHYAGEEVDELFSSLPDIGEKKDYDKAKKVLTDYFTQTKNIAFETYKFHEAVQGRNESIDEYYIRLKKLALTCEFPNEDRAIKSQIIHYCKSKSLRRKALRDDLPLQDILKSARAQELSEEQAKVLEGDEKKSSYGKPSVNAVKPKSRAYGSQHRHSNKRPQQANSRDHANYSASNKPSRPNQRTESSKPADGKKRCYRCGGPFPHPRDKECKAMGQQCRKCGRNNHFESVCKGGKVSKPTVIIPVQIQTQITFT